MEQLTLDVEESHKLFTIMLHGKDKIPVIFTNLKRIFAITKHSKTRLWGMFLAPHGVVFIEEELFIKTSSIPLAANPNIQMVELAYFYVKVLISG